MPLITITFVIPTILLGVLGLLGKNIPKDKVTKKQPSNGNSTKKDVKNVAVDNKENKSLKANPGK